MKIAVIGTVFVDILGVPLGRFIPDGRNAGDVRYAHGGVARNVAIDAANMGADTTFISLVDESGAGQDVLKVLEKWHVDTGYMQTVPDGMGAWLALFDDTGEVYGSISKRPNLLPICDMLKKKGDELFAGLDSVLLEIDIDEPVVAETFRLAEKHQVPVYAVISNMTIALERMEYIRRTKCFVCNRQEAGQLFKTEVEGLSPQEMTELAQKKLPELGLENIVVTMDVDGAVFAEINGDAGNCPARQVEVVNTVGAGDSFFTGVAVGHSQGKTLAEACSAAAEIAARVVGSDANIYIPAEEE